ncbi:MAG: tetratricopeptide repeat protein [Betaproteobacteria bacterium]|nr:tetratricopeptide repeat protein [Betaproteobacteria bacterium]
MSLINKMLQELDNRRAAQGPNAFHTPNPAKLTQQLRPIAAARQVGSEAFWRVVAGLLAVIVGWVFWVMYQIYTPRPLVTELAMQAANRPRPVQGAPAPAIPAPAAGSAAQIAQAPPVQVPAQPSPAQPAQSAAAQPAAAKPPAAEEVPRVDMLRLATDIAAPITGPAKPAPAAKASDKKAAPKPEAKAAKAPAVPTPKPAPQPQLRAGVAPDSGRIDKRVGAAPRERAETEFQRAMAQVNQGRMAEGMDGLRAAIATDPSYEVARQTLISLLLETKRTDEAASALQEALAINPGNVGFAMLLARIRVERGDLNGGLALLQKYEAAGRNNAEHHAFVAALYQRLGRHPEAIDQYQVALRIASGRGAWWVGLGISQEASGQRKEAAESFRRAKASGVLSADLVAYVDQRLKQLP